jgi:hypothetical protein
VSFEKGHRNPILEESSPMSSAMTFYIVYGSGILLAAIALRSGIKMNRELHEKNRAARHRDARQAQGHI